MEFVSFIDLKINDAKNVVRGDGYLYNTNCIKYLYIYLFEIIYK